MKKTYIILAVLILAIGVAGIIGYPMYKEYMITSDPVNHVMYSFSQNYEDYRTNATVDMTISMDKEETLKLGVYDQMTQDPEKFVDFMNAVIGKVHFKYDVNMLGEKNDFKSIDIEEDLSLEYDGKQLIGLDMNIKPYVFSVFSTQLHEKGFELDIDKLIQVATGVEISLNDLDIQKYINLITEKDALYTGLAGNEKLYTTAIYNFLDGKVEKLGKGDTKVVAYGEEKTFKTYNYKINMSVLEIYELYAEVLKVAKEDENAKAFIIDRANKIVEVAREDEFFKKLGAEVEDFDTMLKELEKLETEYETGMDEIINEFTSIKDNPAFEEIKMESSMDIAIDSDHKVRALTMNMTSGFMKIKQHITYNAYGDEVKAIDKFSKLEKIDASQFFVNPNSEENQLLYQELMTNVVSEVISGEALEAILTDIEVEANNNLSEEEAKQLIAQISMFKQQLPMLIQMMTMGMGM